MTRHRHNSSHRGLRFRRGLQMQRDLRETFAHLVQERLRIDGSDEHPLSDGVADQDSFIEKLVGTGFSDHGTDVGDFREWEYGKAEISPVDQTVITNLPIPGRVEHAKD